MNIVRNPKFNSSPSIQKQITICQQIPMKKFELFYGTLK
jgi:hypothetical protein